MTHNSVQLGVDTSRNTYNLDADTEIALLKKTLWLRLCEDTLARKYPEQEMRTPCHFGTGEEAIAAGVCHALNIDDVVYSHHRCHNHFLAKGGSFFELAAELYGRVGGCANGRGGSVHLTDRKKGFIATSAILGEAIAVGAGSAFAFKMDGLSKVAVPFFGDASCEEGSFYETLNFAATFKIPALFILENNEMSTESRADIRMAKGASIWGRARSLGIPAECIDGNNVFEIYNKVREVLPHIRSGNGPYFLECTTYRWREHVGPGFDYDVPARKFRSREEQQSAMKVKDPVKNAREYLIEKGIITAAEFENWQNTMQIEIDDTLEKVKQSPWPDVASMHDNIY